MKTCFDRLMLTSVPVVVESLAGITQHAVSMRRSRKEYTYIREKGKRKEIHECIEQLLGEP